MKIDCVNNQNFGMALKIKCSKDILSKKSIKELKELEKAGKELKNTEYYQLEINKNGRREITSCFGDRYYNMNFNEEPYDNYLGYWGTKESELFGQKVDDLGRGYIEFSNKEAAIQAYKDINNSKGIEKDIKIVKYLDDSMKAALGNKGGAKAEELSDNLIQKYGA